MKATAVKAWAVIGPRVGLANVWVSRTKGGAWRQAIDAANGMNMHYAKARKALIDAGFQLVRVTVEEV